MLLLLYKTQQSRYSRNDVTDVSNVSNIQTQEIKKNPSFSSIHIHPFIHSFIFVSLLHIVDLCLTRQNDEYSNCFFFVSVTFFYSSFLFPREKIFWFSLTRFGWFGHDDDDDRLAGWLNYSGCIWRRWWWWWKKTFRI